MGGGDAAFAIRSWGFSSSKGQLLGVWDKWADWLGSPELLRGTDGPDISGPLACRGIEGGAGASPYLPVPLALLQGILWVAAGVVER